MDVEGGRAGDAETLIFVNYRGGDAGAAAGFVHAVLSERFGESAVFLDYGSSPFGRDFQEVLFSRVRASAVLLVIIGDRWLGGVVGQRLIDDPDDWVRREIVEALRNDIPVVPVLFDGVTLSVDLLPPELAVLVDLQCFEVRARRQRHDLVGLADRLASVIPRSRDLSARGLSVEERSADDQRDGRAGLFAHSASSVSGDRHGLGDHVRSTARLAGDFAAVFGARELAFVVGLFHDAGKAECSWQGRLLACELAGGGRVGGPHWELGARLLADAVGEVGMAILGHHGGLGTVEKLEEVLGRETVDEARTVERFLAEVPEAREWLKCGEVVPAVWRGDPLVLEMGLRLVFSALVDADFLDTAAHFQGLPPPRVAARVDWVAVVTRFEVARARLLRERVARRGVSPVDGDRARLYERVVGKAGSRSGVFRLPAPTGSGKTITAAGFAVRHAAVWGKSRVVVAVPFVTITEQNAAVYRDLLSDEFVLEHHSQVDYDADGDHRARLLAENWDAPFVVTTTVQLFDSLFGRRPSRSRKLHRLADAVVVLDEVQALPRSLLVPILNALRVLVEHFGTTVVLTSATQPTFEALGVWKDLDVQELVEPAEAVALFARLKRVRYEWRLDPRPTLAQVADEVCAAPERQALVVVNTIEHARRMFALLAERTDVPVRHLSTRMCPLHRRHVLAEVTELLAAGSPVVLVSTQLIEAGVDIEFPVVFRAWAPAESVQQAAGRGNREGRWEWGRVVVFNAVDAPPPSFYRLGVGSTRLFFGPESQGLADPDDVAALADYYRHLYSSAGADRDKRGVAIQQAREALDFLSVTDGPLRDGGGVGRDSSLAFRMIDDDTVPVVVPCYRDAEESPDQVNRWLTELADPTRRRAELFRSLRPYTVTVPRRFVTDKTIAPMLSPVVGDLSRWDGVYDDFLGLGEGMCGTEMVL